jgi:hypothetical protein
VLQATEYQKQNLPEDMIATIVRIRELRDAFKKTMHDAHQGVLK